MLKTFFESSVDGWSGGSWQSRISYTSLSQICKASSSVSVCPGLSYLLVQLENHQRKVPKHPATLHWKLIWASCVRDLILPKLMTDCWVWNWNQSITLCLGVTSSPSHTLYLNLSNEIIPNWKCRWKHAVVKKKKKTTTPRCWITICGIKKSVFVVACDELIFNQSKSEAFKQG